MVSALTNREYGTNPAIARYVMGAAKVYGTATGISAMRLTTTSWLPGQRATLLFLMTGLAWDNPTIPILI
jgi:hypothetical protein